jgi:asparagine synthase (glutamine-hydrolysing)
MCGIFALLNSYFDLATIKKEFEKGKGRGPEHSEVLDLKTLSAFLGFHRLAINGLNEQSNQPITIGRVTLICNGEIYNYKELYSLMNIHKEDLKTDSDCEVIIHLYRKYGINQTLKMLDGVFSFILLENDYTTDMATMYVARDPFGVRPLYQLVSHNISKNNFIYGFASEIKMLSQLALFKRSNIQHFPPGTYSKYTFPYKVLSSWKLEYSNEIYHSTAFPSFSPSNITKIDTVYSNIQHFFSNAVKKRCLVTERPVACLLSGGLDSSLVAALANEYIGQSKPIETYSIGLIGSVDLKYAKIVADYLGTKHTEIVLTEKEFIDAIPEVIYTIESFDTTTVRASIGNYFLGKYISQNSQAKVILNGDGSDELMGGYLYMHKCPDALEFDNECRRLLKDIHMYDVLRSDKCISSHGLEPRTPFLDRSWTQYYLSIDLATRYHPGNKQCEKHLIRKAFSKENFLNKAGKQLLPDEVLFRRKEAFSDGVSETTRSLYEIIGEYTQKKFDKSEKDYYLSIFNSNYGNSETNVVPYYWMPKYVEAKDASARTLDIYLEGNQD